MDMDEVLRASTVPAELMPAGVEREPMSTGFTYESLMALLRRVEDMPYGPFGHEPDDWFEAVRHEGETRRQAKSRVMLEEYTRTGGQVRDGDLWALRAQYVWIHQYVQGRGEGLKYNTHNWVHFYNRYGMGGQEPVIMIGLRKDTVAEMTRLCAAESDARTCLRILGEDDWEGAEQD